jgi:hypothetical protein
MKLILYPYSSSLVLLVSEMPPGSDKQLQTVIYLVSIYRSHHRQGERLREAIVEANLVVLVSTYVYLGRVRWTLY